MTRLIIDSFYLQKRLDWGQSFTIFDECTHRCMCNKTFLRNNKVLFVLRFRILLFQLYNRFIDKNIFGHDRILFVTTDGKYQLIHIKKSFTNRHQWDIYGGKGVFEDQTPLKAVKCFWLVGVLTPLTQKRIPRYTSDSSQVEKMKVTIFLSLPRHSSISEIANKVNPLK